MSNTDKNIGALGFFVMLAAVGYELGPIAAFGVLGAIVFGVALSRVER